MTAVQPRGSKRPLDPAALAKLKSSVNGFLACRRLPLVYFVIPKNGCTSIKNFMHQIDSGRRIANPLLVHRLINMRDILLNSRKPVLLSRAIAARKVSFAFSRHPLPRAYSCFMDKIFFVHEFSFPKVREHLVEDYGLRVPDIPDAKPGQTVDMASLGYSADQHRDNFLRYLRFVEDNVAGRSRLRRDAHWTAQTSRLTPSVRSRIDVFPRLENFATEFPKILERAGFTGTLDLATRFNETPRLPLSVGDVADDAVKDLVGRIYERDFVEFGYAMESFGH